MVSRFPCIAMFPSPDAFACSVLPSSGYRGRHLTAGPAVPHLLWYYDLIRLLATPPGYFGSLLSRAYPNPEPAWSVTGEPRLCLSGEMASPPRFLGDPFDSMPRAWDSGGPCRPRSYGRPGSAFGQANGLGFRNDKTISELTLAACYLAVYASSRRSPPADATLATGLPATALTGLDSHQLGPIKRFHPLMSDSSFPRLCAWRDSLDSHGAPWA